MNHPDPANVSSDPLVQFDHWFADAVRQSPGHWFEPEAMTLATADLQGVVTARIVLLKNHDAAGFKFFSHYESRKGLQLQENPRCALIFHWPFSGRQIRIEGRVNRLTSEESDAYFNSRPRGSRIGALASRQSKPIQSRQVLEEQVARIVSEYPDPAILPRPESWGGYCCVPNRIEFWQAGESRLHDRVCYRRGREDESWIIERLSP